MKLQCIDHNTDDCSTFVIKIKQHTILINCPLDTQLITRTIVRKRGNDSLSSLLSSYAQKEENRTEVEEVVFRIPNFRLIDIHSIDLVLVSNYSLMLGLPYLTEYLGYKGKIIATEPNIEFARHAMTELVQYHSKKPYGIEPEALMSASLEGWRSIYTLNDINACIDKIQPVRYTESQDVSSTLRCIAYSSGYCLGSAHWLIETSFFKKIAFLSTSTLQPNLHPLPLDPAILTEANVVIVSGIAPSDPFFHKARAKVLAQIARTIQAKHNVIMPSSTMGLVYDLIGDIHHHFKMVGMEIGHESHQTPIYVVSPIAERSLKYANICGEWMTSDRQDLLYIPESPLVHGTLMKTGALTTFTHMDYAAAQLIREPCIVFTGDPLHINNGALPWFLKRWGISEFNTCIFTDPQSPLNPKSYLSYPCQINFIRTPLDIRTTLEDMTSLLHQYWTMKEERHLVIPNRTGIDMIRQDMDDTRIHVYEVGDIIAIDLNRDWERVTISEKLAKTLLPKPLPNNQDGSLSLYAPIQGLLYLYNNHYELHPITSLRYDPPQISHPYLNDLTVILKRLEENGLTVQILKQNNKITIQLPVDMKAHIIIDGISTSIHTQNEHTRTFLHHLLSNNT